jgi:hypothetical protein
MTGKLFGSPFKTVRPAARRQRVQTRPSIEFLEERTVPTTLTVTSALDDGAAGTLRQVIDSAAPDSTIVFAKALAGQTIHLHHGELLIGKNLTIRGLGAGSTIIDGGGSGRVFDIAAGADVSLSRLKVTGGQVTGFGGGILNEGTLDLSFAVVTGNTANGAESFGGGGIENDGTATIRWSDISNNTAAGMDNPGDQDAVDSGGGGIGNKGTLTISNSRITGNTADDGGGLRNDEGSLTFIGNLVANNTANETVAGGIESAHGKSTYIADSVIINNSVKGLDFPFFGGTGGGIDVEFGPATIVDCVIAGNSASTEGGGISAFGGATLDIRYDFVSGNTAGQGGGGGLEAQSLTFLGLPANKVTIEQSIFADNSTTGNGGAVEASSTSLTIEESALLNNSAAGNGGGVFFDGQASLAVTHSLVAFNKANQGGGLYLAATPPSEDLTGSLFKFNSPDNIFP